MSQQQLTSVNGYLEFTVSGTNLVRYIGLNHNSTGTSAAEIPFAIKLVSGYAEVRELGMYRADIPVADGDVLRIEVRSGVVSYFKNGGLFYISGSTASYPLRVDAALLSSGASLANARVYGFTAPTLRLALLRTRVFHFTWGDVIGETEYRLLENPDGVSGYNLVATMPADTVSYDLEVFLPDRVNASYILQACNAAGCTDSPQAVVRGTLAEAVGYVKASNAGGQDRFGGVIAFSDDGSTLAISAVEEDSAATGINGNQNDNTASDSGAVYIFVRGAAGWNQQAYIKASNTDMFDNFGNSIALSADGNTLAVGAWAKESVAAGTSAPGFNESIEGYGAAYVFVRNGGNWTQQAYLRSSNPDKSDLFGASVALSGDGNTLAVGARSEDSAATGINGDQSDNSALESGAVYVFVRNGGAWTQQAYLKASDVPVYPSYGWFGASVAMSEDGNTLAVGADRLNKVYIFMRNTGNWSQQASMPTSGRTIALSNDGNTLATGAPESGLVQVFVRNTGTWTHQSDLKASNTQMFDHFGSSVALSGDGNILAVGAELEWSSATGINGNQQDRSAREAGAAYILKRNAGNWSHHAYIKASNTQDGDYFGGAIALSGDGATLAVGSDREDSSATGVNGDQSNNSAGFSGAVYLY